MTFEKVCKLFLLQEPFYGIILSSIDKIPTNSLVDTMGVGKAGNTFKLWYNPAFIEKLDTDTLCSILKHEVLHLCLQHPFIGQQKGYDKDEQTHNLYNAACDLEVNCYLDKDKVKGIKPLYVEDFGYDRCLGSISYYNLLSQNKKQQKSTASSQPDKPCNGGKQSASTPTQDNSAPQASTQSNQDNQENSSSFEQTTTSSSESQSGQKSASAPDSYAPTKKQEQVVVTSNTGKDIVIDTIDDHSVWPKDISRNETERLVGEVEALVAFAAEEVEKGQGTIPGEVAGIIERIRKKPKPVADWKKYCRRFMGNEYTFLTKKSRRRESKRFPGAAGNRHVRKSRILVAIDTSGSVSMPEYKEFMGQMLTMKEKADFHVVECDAQIQHEYEFKGTIPTTLHGGGGTNFQPVIDMFIQNQREYDCLVYFTDGYCQVPSNTPKDTLWVISSQGDHTRKKYAVNGASSVFIPKTNN